MTDLILIHPPNSLSDWELKLGSKLPPLGLASLAAYVRDKGVSVRILDALNLGLSSESVLDFIKQHSPAYVGITATTNMIDSAANLACQIKNRFPHVVTIIGGAHVSALPEETLSRFSSFDAGVFGEGEITLYEIINAGKIDHAIKGIVFNSNGTVLKNQPREYINNLDDLPFPAYDLLPDFPTFYRPTPNNYTLLPIAAVVSSRGCPYSCTFCDRQVFGRKLRDCSTDYLISMLKHLQNRYGIREVCFYDDIFMLNKNKMLEFIDKLLHHNLNLSWSCEGRVDQLNEQFLRDMKRAGCWQVNYGIESCSQKVLDGFNKKITVDQIKQALISTRKAKLHARAYLIIGSPAETMQTLEETRNFILNVPVSDIHISYLTPLPGSDIYKEISGTCHVEDFNKINQYSITYTPPQLNKEILTNYMNNLYKKFYLHPQRLLRYFLMLFNRHKTLHLMKACIEFCKLIYIKSRQAPTRN